MALIIIHSKILTLSKKTFSIMTLSIIALSIITLSIKGLLEALSITALH
jgi:hypothetical protein